MYQLLPELYEKHDPMPYEDEKYTDGLRLKTVPD